MAYTELGEPQEVSLDLVLMDIETKSEWQV